MNINASLEELEATRQKLLSLLQQVEPLIEAGEAQELRVVKSALAIIEELILEKRANLDG